MPPQVCATICGYAGMCAKGTKRGGGCLAAKRGGELELGRQNREMHSTLRALSHRGPPKNGRMPQTREPAGWQIGVQGRTLAAPAHLTGGRRR